MKEELKQFDIDIEDITPCKDFFENLLEAINKMHEYTLKDRFEVVLNNNLIESKEKLTNYRTILGCRISYDNLDKNISFIVREDKEPSYEELEKRIEKAIKMLYKLEENMNKDLKMWYGAGLNIKHFEVRDIRDIIKNLGGKNE